MRVFVVFILLACSFGAYSQTAGELVSKNIEARGGMSSIKAIDTVELTGRILTPQGYELAILLRKKRPNKMRMEYTVQGATGVQAFDGKTAWSLMPFAGAQVPQVLPAEEGKEIEQQAEFDGPLVDYKQKGNTIEYAGTAAIDGAEAYNLKLKMKNGDLLSIYLDGSTYLETNEHAIRESRGSKHEFESTASDYRSVNGVKFPFLISIGEKGSAERQKIAIDKIKVNVPMDEALFKVPANAVAPKAAASDAANPGKSPARVPGQNQNATAPAAEPPKDEQ
jgi:outer membrane lipoprotein-sorting protein